MHHATGFTSFGFFAKSHVVEATFCLSFLARCCCCCLFVAVTASTFVAAFIGNISTSRLCSTSAAAAAAAVVDAKLLLLALAEADCVDVVVERLVFECRGEVARRRYG